MFSQFGPLEIVLVIVVLLVIFGPKRLPSLGRQLGAGMREFKDSVTGNDKRGNADEAQPALTKAQQTAPPAAEHAPAEPAPAEGTREPRA